RRHADLPYAGRPARLRCVLRRLREPAGHADDGDLCPTEYCGLRRRRLRLGDQPRHLCDYRHLCGGLRDHIEGGASMSRRRTVILTRAAFYLLLAMIVVYLIFPFYWVLRSAIVPNSV